MKRSTFNVLFFVKHTKKLKDGSVPIYARITINGNRTDFGLQRGVEGSQWDAAKGKAKGSSKQIKELNQYLDTVRGNLLIKKWERGSRLKKQQKDIPMEKLIGCKYQNFLITLYTIQLHRSLAPLKKY